MLYTFWRRMGKVEGGVEQDNAKNGDKCHQQTCLSSWGLQDAFPALLVLLELWSPQEPKQSLLMFIMFYP